MPDEVDVPSLQAARPMDRLRHALMVAALLFEGVAIAEARADEDPMGILNGPLCRRIVVLKNAKQLNAIAVPFGEIDVDNDGVAETVSEVVSGGAGAHSIQIIDGGVNSGPVTCSGCGSVFSTGVQVLRVDGQHYVAEYDKGLLSALWQPGDVRDNFAGAPLCAFIWDFTARLDDSLGGDQPVCQALVDGRVQPVASVEFPYPSSKWPRLTLADRLKKAAGFPSEVRARSEPIAADIDNDGDADTLVRAWLARSGGRGCGRQSLLLLDGTGSVEDSPRNIALLAAQAASSCDDPRFVPFSFDGRAYIEGKNTYEIEARPPAPSLPRSQSIPYWTAFDWQGDKPVQICRFEFDRRVRTVPLR